ncbi:MAG: Asp-tRNA(Asn)/Glu-tRNA(Gln) amidotransferase subunit GatB [bacterium]
MGRDERYEPVIGLEVHAQLLTQSKAFCGCSTTFGNEPNSNVCPVCLGMPGVLPVLNLSVVEFAMKMGLATNCTIVPESIFARKNYFYPDLPKGYQISQYEEPICSNGFIEIELEDSSSKRIGITRIHIEEDAGKSIHDLDADTLVDVNRCGVPLIEIVSEPDLRSPREAYLYLTKIKQLVTYLDICDGNMEEGSLRCDANISVRRKGESSFGTKTELKNLNSFRFVEKALEFEINRQIGLLEHQEQVVQETLLWNADQGIATAMRSKEEAHDYRYFPDPDLIPIRVDENWRDRIRSALPEDPTIRRNRFIREFNLPSYDASILTQDRRFADFYESVIGSLKEKVSESYKLTSNWMMGDVLRVVNEKYKSIADFPVPPQHMSAMINLIAGGTISSKIAKEVFDEMLKSGEAPSQIVERKGLVQVSNHGEIERIITDVLERNEAQVQAYLHGKSQVFGFFVGETMKATKGKANPKIVNELLKKKLDALK